MSSIENIGMNSMQPPGPKDLFSRTDSDRSGGVSQTELQKLSEKLLDKTGKTLDVGNDAFSSYDSDGSGSLSGEELKAVLDNAGFGPSLGMQGMAPPPPPPPQQASDSYKANLPGSEQEMLSKLVSSLQDLLDTLTSYAEKTPQGPPAGSPPNDIFGKVDTDRSGSLSKDELKVLAENIKKTTGQTLDISDEAIAALDKNGDGELTPDEVDLRKTLSLPSADLNGNPDAKDLKVALNQSWAQAQQGSASDTNQQGSLLEQMKEIKGLLETLTKYYAGIKNGTESPLSVTS